MGARARKSTTDSTSISDKPACHRFTYLAQNIKWHTRQIPQVCDALRSSATCRIRRLCDLDAFLLAPFVFVVRGRLYIVRVCCPHRVLMRAAG